MENFVNSIAIIIIVTIIIVFHSIFFCFHYVGNIYKELLKYTQANEVIKNAHLERINERYTNP